jgi:heme exporter protein C
VGKYKALDYVLLVGSIVFILVTIFMAIYYVPLVATDVSIVVLASADDSDEYTEFELRIKGTVDDYSGTTDFDLQDVANSVFELNIIHDGDLPPGLSDGDAVIITGVLVDTDTLTFESTDIEVVDDYDSAGWVAPYAQKIFYLHTPAAWASYLAFGVVFVGSIIYLKNGSNKWDTAALASAEIGVMFCTLAIITGPIWAKPEWGVYWRWEDTKLLTTFVMWMIYLGYITLRLGMGGRGVARMAAVFGIIGFVAIPLSFISSRVWQSLHPNPVGQSGGLSAEAGMTLMVGVIAMSFLYFYLLKKRIELEEAKHKVEELKDNMEGEIE